MSDYERVTLKQGEPKIVSKRVYYRLRELEDKIENGTLIELPCRVGDKVYWVFELVKNKLEILEGKIRGISISHNNTSWFSVIYEFGLTFEHTFKDYWLKTVFPTKAEAEKKLEELTEGK